MIPPSSRKVILLIGSNIEPFRNILLAIEELKTNFSIDSYSSIWETKPIGSDGNNFLNLALTITTDLDYGTLKFGSLRDIESKFGRVRTPDKFASRTLDIDVILDGDIIRDENIWKYVFAAVPVAELVPDLTHPVTHQSLADIARDLTITSWIIKYPAGI